MNEIKMPQLSDSMEEGTILSWLVNDGQSVSKGDELVELETDKATMTYESEVSGVLQIVAAEGDTIPVGELIARIGSVEVTDDGEPRNGSGSLGGAANRSEMTDSPVPGIPSIPGSTGVRSSEQAPAGGVVARPWPRKGDSDEQAEDSHAVATPLAKRIASAHGIDLTTLPGSGPRGRITKVDVFRAAGIDGAPQGTPEQPSAFAPAGSAPVAESKAGGVQSGQTQAAKGASDQVEMTRFQSVVARRMAESKATIPHYQVQTEVVMDGANELRTGFKAVGDGQAAPTFSDMIVKASALALREFPQANGSFETGRYVLYERVNVGFAVAAEDALVVPTIVDADQKTLSGIRADSKRLAERVRSGEVTPPELAGATFTVSNLGMYGMTAIYPVINPPQVAILGVGAMRETLRRDDDGEVVDSFMLTLTLSCDHRMLNGADASRFLFQIKENLEQPLKLVL
jgi:pyruvate dehydrogenase E2 component (dihydrolipoamide acetyltransferase)